MIGEIIARDGRLYVRDQWTNNFSQPIQYRSAWLTGVFERDYPHLVGEEVTSLSPGTYETKNGGKIELENGWKTMCNKEYSEERPIPKPQGKKSIFMGVGRNKGEKMLLTKNPIITKISGRHSHPQGLAYPDRVHCFTVDDREYIVGEIANNLGGYIDLYIWDAGCWSWGDFSRAAWPTGWSDKSMIEVLTRYINLRKGVVLLQHLCIACAAVHLAEEVGEYLEMHYIGYTAVAWLCDDCLAFNEAILAIFNPKSEV